jgi:hypothetical protein
VFTIDICEHIAEIALSSPIALIGMTQWSLAKLRVSGSFRVLLDCAIAGHPGWIIETTADSTP